MNIQIVSIILPTYNGARYIADAIESVQAQIFPQWELLVIDDGSTDNTLTIVQELALKDSRVIYLKNDHNLGIQKTLNRGLHVARGKYIARIDDDDQWIETKKLEKQVEFLDTHPDYVLVGTGVVMIDEENKELVRYLLPESDRDIRKKILGKNCFVHSSVLFKKEAALQFGGYDETQATRHVEDYDLWLKLGTDGKFANLSIYATQFMLREGGLSSRNKIEQFKKNIRLAKKYKKNYPRYWSAIIRSWVRIVLYGLVFKLPVKYFINKGMKWYKEQW